MISGIRALKAAHRARRPEIRRRLAEFAAAGRSLPEESLFLELVFCLLTPQSRARAADAAVRKMGKPGFRWDRKGVRSALVGVRFPNNKTKFVLLAREKFTLPSGETSVRDRLAEQPPAARAWLVKNVKGLGMKEASHFLRNIGRGAQLAILDVHVLRRLHPLGITEEFIRTLSEKRYLELEKELLSFCRKKKIPLAELDLVLWSDATGEIFK